MKRSVAVVFMSLVIVLPALGITYKTTYPDSCSQMWPAVKDVLSNPNEYDVTKMDDARMHADYDVKHSAHVNISGALLQRKNHVTLVPKGAGCEMQVVSNYSGWEHNDQGDFTARVEQALAKIKAGQPTEATAKPADASK